MLRLGNVDAEEVKREFLEKFHEQREDASEYQFGVMKGEMMETSVYHAPCGQTFTSRPYLFIQSKWAKQCPYCYSYKKQELSEFDVQERVAEYSVSTVDVVENIESYIGDQKVRHVELKCRVCGLEFRRNFNNIRGTLTCPNEANH